DDGPEEGLPADGASDDQVARVDSAVTEEGGCLDELPEALRGVDEAEERDDRSLRREAQNRLGLLGVPGSEAVEVHRVRHDGRPDAEDAGDVAVDRDRRRRETGDGAADDGGPAIAPAVGQRRAKMPDDRQP